MPKTCPVCSASYADTNSFCPIDGATLYASELQEELIGAVVADRYLITDLIGEGGMGKVYLARHVRLPQQAAIKVLRADQVRDAATVARFNREAANASRIDHDRVARVYDFGETRDGTVYLAMEYVAGRTMRRMIAEDGPIPPRRAARLVRQIAEGLDAAHRLGIVHRDLKPDNVMVVEDASGEDRVKVLDFGIAKALDATEGGGGLTRTGFVVGTPEYMSPEQLTGGPVDARTDIYALGLVAFNAFTGDIPFDTSTPERVLTSRLVEQPRRLEAVLPASTWTAAVQSVLDRALAREPDDRPPSAGLFGRQLLAAVERTVPSKSGVMPIVQPPPRTTGSVPVAAAPIPTEIDEETPTREWSAPVTEERSAPIADERSAPITRERAPAVRTERLSRTLRPKSRVPVLAGGAIGAAVVIAALTFARARAPGAGEHVAAAPPPAATPTPPPAAVPPPPSPRPRADGAAPPARTGAAAGEVVAGAAATRTAAVTDSAPVDSAEAAALERRRASSRARRDVERIVASLDPARTDPESATRAVDRLRELMPQLGSAVDSTRALIGIAEALALSGDDREACATLQRAGTLATRSRERDEVQRFNAQLGCSQ